jgi:hypothetical protein
MEKTFAVLNGNVVTNVIIAESKEIAEEATGLTCVEYTQENPAGIGWTYDGEKFVSPVVRELTE